MCKIMEDMRNEALEIGRAEGRIEGRIDGRVEGRVEGRAEEHLLSLLSHVSSLKAKLGFSDQQIRDALSLSNEDWALIADKL